MLPPLFVMPVGTVTGVVGAGDTGDWVLLGEVVVVVELGLLPVGVLPVVVLPVGVLPVAPPPGVPGELELWLVPVEPVVLPGLVETADWSDVAPVELAELAVEGEPVPDFSVLGSVFVLPARSAWPPARDPVAARGGLLAPGDRAKEMPATASTATRATAPARQLRAIGR